MTGTFSARGAKGPSPEGALGRAFVVGLCNDTQAQANVGRCTETGASKPCWDHAREDRGKVVACEGVLLRKKITIAFARGETLHNEPRKT